MLDELLDEITPAGTWRVGTANPKLRPSRAFTYHWATFVLYSHAISEQSMAVGGREAGYLPPVDTSTSNAFHN